VSTELEPRREARQRLRDKRRRRRYALIDSTVGTAIAVAGFTIAPGIGIVALLAIVVLCVCGMSLIARRALRRRQRPKIRSTHGLERRAEARPGRRHA
jgi:membrane protein implicated in regulation of membrane protease activity